MVTAAVVENHVHHHLQALAVSLVDETAIIVVGAEAWVNLVVIGGSIAVVGRVVVAIG